MKLSKFAAPILAIGLALGVSASPAEAAVKTSTHCSTKAQWKLADSAKIGKVVGKLYYHQKSDLNYVFCTEVSKKSTIETTLYGFDDDVTKKVQGKSLQLTGKDQQVYAVFSRIELGSKWTAVSWNREQDSRGYKYNAR